MGGKKLKRMVLSLALGAVALVPVRGAAATSVISWTNPATYSDMTSIPPSLQASIETRLYYSYDNREWTLYATVPDGGTSWTGELPLAGIVQGFYAFTSTIPGEGIESRLSDSIPYPPPVAGEGGTYTVSLGSCTDTYVNTGWSSLDTYSTEPLIGTYTWPARNAANRGFIQWDLSPLPPNITVTGATLGLYYAAEEGGGGDDSYQVSVAKVTGVHPVLDLANWNTYDGVTPWSAGGDGGASNLAAPESSALVNKLHGWVTWDVTKMVQEWAAAPETNHGMAIDADGAATADSNRFFASREHPDLYPRPQLVVTYTYDPTATVILGSYTDTHGNHRRHYRHPEVSPIGTHAGTAFLAANRAGMRWDLSSLPPDVTVTSATLGLYHLAEGDGGADAAYEVTVAKATGAGHAHRSRLRNRNDSRHRNRYDDAAAWSERRDGGTAQLAAPESSAIVNKAQGWVTWDVTQMVQGWVAAPETNHGMVVDGDGSDTADSNRYFASREHPDPDLRPQLVITYQSNRQ